MKQSLSEMFKTRSVVMMSLGLVFCSLGVALQSKTSFGVGVIQASAYAVYMYVSESWPVFTYGISSYLMEGIFLILLCLIIRRFRWKFLFSFVTAFIFGLLLDLWILIIGSDVPDNYELRALLWALGTISICFAVACYFRTRLPQEVWELFVAEFAQKFRLDSSKVKWGFDISMLVIGIALCFIFFGRFRLDITGPGTIACALISGPIIGVFGKYIDRFYPEKKDFS